jgi:hypothetical protein
VRACVVCALVPTSRRRAQLYLGGAIWGVANGWAYVPPVSTLIKWFPHKKARALAAVAAAAVGPKSVRAQGFASGACLMGYGGGAMVAAPLFTEVSLTVSKRGGLRTRSSHGSC